MYLRTRPSNLFDEIAASAGVRGTQIVLAPADYLRATKAVVTAIARDTLDRDDTALAARHSPVPQLGYDRHGKHIPAPMVSF